MSRQSSLKAGRSQTRPQTARFLTGSIMSHILKMTFASSIGLIAIFSVDFVDLIFLSQLDDTAIQAALGFTGTILFATISLGIGLSIAAAATIARAAGEQNHIKTHRRITNNLIYAFLISSFVAILLYLSLPIILTILGAEGQVHTHALNYLKIIVPTMPIFSLSICSAAMLRGLGNAKSSALITIGGGLVNAILDPIFIFGLDLGMDGAAYASAIARLAMVTIGFYGLFIIERSSTPISKFMIKKDVSAFQVIAVPAILTNLATPIGNAYVTYMAAGYGDETVAAWAIITRIVPLSFCAVFALSGAIGPIIGQNLGGKQFPRIRQTLKDAIKFNTIYTLTIWLALIIAAPFINSILQLDGKTAEIITFFCYWLAPIFGTIGYMFIANAALNNLDKPHISMWLNWARATIGTIPFVYVGGLIADSYGLFAGHMIGGAMIALVSLKLSNDTVNAIENRASN